MNERRDEQFLAKNSLHGAMADIHIGTEVVVLIDGIVLKHATVRSLYLEGAVAYAYSDGPDVFDRQWHSLIAETRGKTWAVLPDKHMSHQHRPDSDETHTPAEIRRTRVMLTKGMYIWCNVQGELYTGMIESLDPFGETLHASVSRYGPTFLSVSDRGRLWDVLLCA